MQDSEFNDQIIINIDSRYAVVISKDHNQGVVVQVTRMNPTHVKGDSGIAYKGHMPVVLRQQVVQFGTINKSSGEVIYKDDAQLQSEIIDAVVKGKELANKCILKENFIDQVFTKIKTELK